MRRGYITKNVLMVCLANRSRKRSGNAQMAENKSETTVPGSFFENRTKDISTEKFMNQQEKTARNNTWIVFEKINAA